MSIVWLASYPKSGNTWVRAFLTSYRCGATQPADINALATTGIGSSRAVFDRFTGLRSCDLTEDEIDRLRPDVYRDCARAYPSPILAKVHDRYDYLPDGSPLFPPDATRCAIYVVRNPLDVAVSGAAHFDLDGFDAAIAGMASDAVLSETRTSLSLRLRQRLGSWSGHVRSWALAPVPFPVLVVRYEDMLLCPREAFSAVVGAAGLPMDPAHLERAIEFSSFERLKRQEEESGFLERVSRSLPFFRRGRAGDWVDHLSERQVQKIIADHGEVMRAFGYLDGNGQIVSIGAMDRYSPEDGKAGHGRIVRD